MATRAETEKLLPDEEAAEGGYAAWKKSKIERGMAQSRDRAAMISIEQVRRDLDA